MQKFSSPFFSRENKKVVTLKLIQRLPIAIGQKNTLKCLGQSHQ